jgi:hypothetical protein
MHENCPEPSVKRGHTFNVVLLELGDAVRAQHLFVQVRVRVRLRVGGCMRVIALGYTYTCVQAYRRTSAIHAAALAATAAPRFARATASARPSIAAAPAVAAGSPAASAAAAC